MEEMEPQRRLEWDIERVGDAELGGNLRIASRWHNRREIRRHIKLRLIELRLLHGQVGAHTLALRVTVARDVGWLTLVGVAMITMLVMATGDVHRLGNRQLIAAAERFVRHDASSNPALHELAAKRQPGWKKSCESKLESEACEENLNYLANRLSKQSNFGETCRQTGRLLLVATVLSIFRGLACGVNSAWRISPSKNPSISAHCCHAVSKSCT